MSFRTTFSLDEATVTGIRRLAQQWGVSQAEVVRRLVGQAVQTATAVAAPARWVDRVQESRRAWPEVSLRTAAEAAGEAPRVERLRRLLERELWPAVPASRLGVALSKADTDALLGYGPVGV